MQLTKDKINYIESICSSLVHSLKKVNQQYEKEKCSYLFHSPARARFKRLRVELAKELMEIQGRIYN